MNAFNSGKPIAFLATMTVAVSMPPLWLGGVTFAAQASFALLTGVALLQLSLTRAPDSAPPPNSQANRHPAADVPTWRIPRGWFVPLILAAITLVACVPLPPQFHAWISPRLWGLRLEALGPQTAEDWQPLSLLPSQALLESARLVSLSVFFVLCAAMRQRRVLVTLLVIGVTSTILGLLGASLVTSRSPVSTHRSTASVICSVQSRRSPGPSSIRIPGDPVAPLPRRWRGAPEDGRL